MTKYRSVVRTILLSTLVTCTGIRDAAAFAPPAYHFTDLGTLGGGNSYALGINASGQVTGRSWTSDFTTHAFLYDGAMHDLGTLGGTYSDGIGVNASEQVTGFARTTGDAADHAFLYDGTMHDLGTLGGTYSSGYGINANGQVTGYSATTGDAAAHAFLYDGTMHDLGTLGGTDSYGSGINDSGQVTGFLRTTGNAAQRAFLWTPTTPNVASGSMIDLGTLGGTSSEGNDINASGQVTGISNTTGNAERHAFLWAPTVPNGTSGTMHDLGTLGGSFSGGLGINASGQVVGLSTTGDAVGHAFLYTNGSGMVDLNSLIDPLSGWNLLVAQAINDAGQITGYASSASGNHAFLLTPVPEPASLALLVLGLPFLVGRKSRRSGTRGIRGALGPMTVLLKL